MNPLYQQMLMSVAQSLTTEQLTNHLLSDGFPQHVIHQLVKLLKDNYASFTR